PGNCAAVCGDKAVDPANNDPAFFSFCSDTALGFRWISAGCPSPNACDPTAACNANPVTDSSTTPCTPRSVTSLTPTTPPTGGTEGEQRCGSDGKWGAVTACKVDQGKVCNQDENFVDLGCGDPICGSLGSGVDIAGICVLDSGISKLRACDSTGNLAAPTDL